MPKRLILDPVFVKEILSIRHKRDAVQLVEKIVSHQYDVNELMECFFSEDWVLCQKASWPLSVLSDHNEDLVLPYLEAMVDNLDRPVHDAVIRNTLRSWQSISIPEDLQGVVYDKAFSYFLEPQQPVAIRVFAMTVCANIAMNHPGLAPEIITVIEDYWDNTTAAWRSRGRKELRRLRKVVQDAGL